MRADALIKYAQVFMDIAEGGMQGVRVPPGLAAPDWFGSKAFRADKPFVIAIQHVATDANLFVGVVSRPHRWTGV